MCLYNEELVQDVVHVNVDVTHQHLQFSGNSLSCYLLSLSAHTCSWPHKVTFRRVVLYVVLYVLEVVRRSRLNEIFNRPRAPGRAGAARGMPRMCLIDCPRHNGQARNDRAARGG